MTEVYTIKYKGQELCFCKTREDAEFITKALRHTLYNHDSVEEMEAAHPILEIEYALRA